MYEGYSQGPALFQCDGNTSYGLSMHLYAKNIELMTALNHNSRIAKLKGERTVYRYQTDDHYLDERGFISNTTGFLFISAMEGPPVK